MRHKQNSSRKNKLSYSRFIVNSVLEEKKRKEKEPYNVHDARKCALNLFNQEQRDR